MRPITPQELSILELIADGRTTRQIANILCLSFHTVQTYRRSLLKKFDATNSVELVKKAIAQNVFRTN